MVRFPTIVPHLRKRINEELSVVSRFIGAEPERTSDNLRRGRTDGLVLNRMLHPRRVISNDPCLAMDFFDAKFGFIREEDISIF